MIKLSWVEEAFKFPPEGTIPGHKSLLYTAHKTQVGKQTNLTPVLGLLEIFPEVHFNNICERYSIPCLDFEKYNPKNQ